MPTLLSYEEELLKLQQLTEENEILKRKVSYSDVYSLICKGNRIS